MLLLNVPRISDPSQIMRVRHTDHGLRAEDNKYVSTFEFDGQTVESAMDKGAIEGLMVPDTGNRRMAHDETVLAEHDLKLLPLSVLEE